MTQPTAGFLIETPLDAVAACVREDVVIEGRTYVLSRPADSDRLLDHPATRGAFAADDDFFADASGYRVERRFGQETCRRFGDAVHHSKN